MPLGVLDIAWPNLDLAGSATGRLDYAWRGDRSGRLDLKVRGLSRAGLLVASKPIDVALAATIGGNSAAIRAVAGNGGTIIGRAQGRFMPLGRGPLVAELLNAPLAAQLRYVGDAGTLWRLTGSEVRPVGAAGDRRGHRRTACDPVSAVRSRQQFALEARSLHGHYGLAPKRAFPDRS